MDWNHVSDDVLWRTTLGYRDDAGVEASMNAQPQNHQHVGDASIQGFDDIRLFTTIDSFQDIKIAPDQEAEEAYPTAAPSAGNSQLFTSSAPNPNRPRSPAASGTYRPQPVSQWTPKVSRGWGRRIAVAAILIVVLASGWVGYFYMTNGKMPENLQSASPLILEQQRKLDAKVNRLLDAIESMPALKGQVKDRKDMEPPSASPESQAKQNPSQP